jgi:hypothetical protein
MRKYFSALSIGMAFLILAILSGCDKDFEEIIDVSTTSYQVTGTSSFSSFRYVVGDSVITIYLNLNSSSNISSVFCDIIASDGKKLNNNPVFLLDNGNAANGDQTAGDNRFTNRFPLSQQNPIGAYRINFYVIDRESTTKLAAVQQFTYDNGQTNVAPVIVNSVIEPDTVVVNDTIPIFCSVEASDINGLSDLEQVYFIVHRPDGSTSGVKLDLLDDGSCCPIPPTNQVSGDLTADDGIFSRIIQVDQNNAKGTYRFEFQTVDRGGLLSNIINHFVLIQ